jgi:dimethylamine monooxygenase subunit A
MIVGMNSLGNTKTMSTDYIYPPPSDGKPFRLNMGLRSLDDALWLEGGNDVEQQIIERCELAVNARDIVYQELPGYQSVINELVQRICVNLNQYHGEQYLVNADSVTYLPSQIRVELTGSDLLLKMAMIIAEDLVVLAREDGEWRIVAGAVLFPSRWKLSEKIGKGMDAVHTPVPGFAESLAPYMTATFDKITADRPVWRKNWSLHSTADLHQPTSIHTAAAPENYWWRTERQTLTRAFAGEFLYFTIRNRAEPLAWIKEDTQSAQAFAETLVSLAPETIEYKGLMKDHQLIIDYLRN